MIRSTEDLLSCATLYPLDAAIDEANTRRDILIAKMKEVIRERGELDCELLLTATMSTREKRIQLTKKIKHLKAALLSSGKRGRPRTLSDAEKKQHRQIWNQTYYRRLQSRARAFLQYGQQPYITRQRANRIRSSINTAARATPQTKRVTFELK